MQSFDDCIVPIGICSLTCGLPIIHESVPIAEQKHVRPQPTISTLGTARRRQLIAKILAVGSFYATVFQEREQVEKLPIPVFPM